MQVADRSAVPIQRTKLHRPAVPTDLVHREKLHARLEAGRRLPLTLVSSPAGYGKTTLVSHWLETCEAPSAWLSLDEADGDIVVFLHYLVAAVRTLFPDACRSSLLLSEAPELPPVPVVARHLSNDLDNLGEPFVLALDDYHRLHEPAVHELVDCLLSHPPRGFHLAVLLRPRSPRGERGQLDPDCGGSEVLPSLPFLRPRTGRQGWKLGAQ